MSDAYLDDDSTSSELDVPAPVAWPVRFSRLKLIGRSPQHYLGMTVRQTQSIERGTATHSLLLGGKRIIGYPGKVRRGKDWEQFKEFNYDAEILTMKDYDRANRMAESVMRNAQAMSVLKGSREVELGWKIGDRQCGGRVDVIGSTYSTELKTGVTSDPRRFMWMALRMGYPAQVAWYRNGIKLAGLGEKKDAFVVMVEQEAPHVVTTFQVTPRALEQGERQWRGWFEMLMNCERSNAWPGYSEAMVPLDVPEDDVELTFDEEAA